MDKKMLKKGKKWRKGNWKGKKSKGLKKGNKEG